MTRLQPCNDAALAAVPTPVSWAMEVHTSRDDAWTGNACRYATKDEAERAGRELLSRWIVPDDSRAVPSTDPVNYKFPVGDDRPSRIED